MRKKLPPANALLAKFHSDNNAAEYFETHSVAGIWDRLAKGQRAKLSAALAKAIREWRESAKPPISLRLAPEQIAAAKKVAAKKSRQPGAILE